MDWDNDGYHDLVVGDTSGNVNLFLNINNNSDPVMDGGVAIQAGGVNIDVGIRATPVVEDWNGDNNKDLLVGNGDGKIQIFINTGTDAAPFFGSSYFLQVGGIDFDSGARAAPRIHDWNNDGLKDILVGDISGLVYYLENTGTNSAPLFESYEKLLLLDGNSLQYPPFSRLFVTDWNEDGENDMIVGSEDGQLKLYLNLKTGLVKNVIPQNGGAITETDGAIKILTAEPNTGYSLNRWTGCDTGTGSSYDDCEVTMDGIKTVTAEFIHSLNPVDTSISFGKVNTGINAQRTITLKNNGLTSLEIGTITNTSSPFSIDKGNCNATTLSPSDACEITVGFSPDSAGTFVSVFEIADIKVAVTGTGADADGSAPDISVSTFNMNDFLNTGLNVSKDNNTTLTVTNDGNAGLAIETIAIAGTHSDKFMLVSNPGNCIAGQMLSPSGSCRLDIRLLAQSQADGPFIAHITIRSNDPDEDLVSVGLIGSTIADGNNPPARPELTFPANGTVSSQVRFNWEDAVDDAGDTLTHHVYYSTDPGFADPVILGASNGNNNLSYAKLYGNPAIIALFGMAVIGGLLKRKKAGLFIAAILVAGGLLLASCGSGVDNGAGNDSIIQTETIYWKVITDDGNGGVTESDTYSFTTSP